MAIKFEVLTQYGRSKRGRFFVKSIARILRKMGREVIESRPVTGNADCLILWGVGGPDQQPAYWKYREQGKPVLMADIGYFGRGKDFRQSSIRVSINDYHPQNLLEEQSPDRFDRERIRLYDAYSDGGHILLCGLGPKSRWLYGYRGQEWERKTLRELELLYPGVPILYRYKPKCPEKLEGTLDGNRGDIFQRLNGCRLCIVHHSNVAVDCAVAGVPCVSFDGVGAHLWPRELGEIYQPTRTERKRFLDSVAYWNWYPDEFGDMIEFLEPKIERLVTI